MTRRRILLFVACLSIATVIWGCSAIPRVPEMPDGLRAAKIDYGNGVLAKTALDQFSDLGSITDLRYGRFSADGEPQLAVVGTAGAAFVESFPQTQKAIIQFPLSTLDRVVLVQSKEGEAPAFLDRGGWISKVRLFDGTGAQRWVYGSFWGIDDAAAGDLYGSGKLEFALGLNGGGGLRLLDEDGHEVWHKSAGNVWHVEIANSEAGAKGRVINSDASGALTVRDADGAVLLTARPTQYVTSFGLARWANATESTRVVVPGEDVIILLDLNGRQTAELEAPGSNANPQLEAVLSVPVCFSARQCYQATLIDYQLWDRSVLYLDDLKGKLAYKEVLGHHCAAAATIPAAPSSANEYLIVGCGSEVWKYASH